MSSSWWVDKWKFNPETCLVFLKIELEANAEISPNPLSEDLGVDALVSSVHRDPLFPC
jgi:hypothetical protein